MPLPDQGVGPVEVCSREPGDLLFHSTPHRYECLQIVRDDSPLGIAPGFRNHASRELERPWSIRSINNHSSKAIKSDENLQRSLIERLNLIQIELLYLFSSDFHRRCHFPIIMV